MIPFLFLRDLIFIFLSKQLNSSNGLAFSVMGSYVEFSDDQKLWCFGPFLCYIVYVIIDCQNEAIVTLVYKALCLIKADEEFNSDNLRGTQKRRFSATYLTVEAEEVQELKEFNKALKEQKYLYSVSYKGNDKKIKAHEKFSKGVLITIFAIRKCIEISKNHRDQRFAEKIQTMQLEADVLHDAESLSSSDNSDDEISDEFIKTKKGRKLKPLTSSKPRKMMTISKPNESVFTSS